MKKRLYQYKALFRSVASKLNLLRSKGLSDFYGTENNAIMDRIIQLDDVEITWNYRKYVNSSGRLANSSKAYSTSLMSGSMKVFAIDLLDPTYQMKIHMYNKDGDTTSGSGFIRSTETYTFGRLYLPSDAIKIVVTVRRTDIADITTSDLPNIESALKLYAFTDSSLSIEGSPADAFATSKSIESINDVIYTDILKESLIENYTWNQGSLDPDTGSLTNNYYDSRVRSFYVPISGSRIKIVLPEGYDYRIFRYSHQIVDGEGFLGYDPQGSWYSYTETTHYVDANLIRVVIRRTDNSTLDLADKPQEQIYQYIIKSDSSNIDDLQSQAIELGLHIRPTSLGELNVVKRARQLTDITWTSDYTFPRISLRTRDTYSDSEGTFKDQFTADHKYSGLPYSKASFVDPDYGYGKYYIGGTVNFEAFLTSLHYPNSGFGTLGGYDASNSATYYGTTCATLQAYVFDADPYATTYYSNDSELSLIGKLVNGSVKLDHKNLHLGDCLGYVNHHAAIITDMIIQDDSLTFVEVSESTKFGNYDSTYKGSQFGGKTRRKLWKADEFYEWFKNSNVYRFNKIDDVKFEPVLGTEDNQGYSTVLPCIPFMGNKFNYIKNKIPNSTILVRDTDSYNYLVVLKDGDPWNIDGSSNPYHITSNTIDVGFYDVGQYQAYLVYIDGGQTTRKSYSCEWNVCHVSASASRSNTTITIVCTTSGNNVPRSVLFGSSFPGRPCTRISTDNYTDTIIDNMHQYTITIDGPTSWSYTQCIVLFKNNLSVWHSEAITIV